MAGSKSLTAREVVGEVMAGEHADVLRESVAVIVREIRGRSSCRSRGCGREAIYRVSWSRAGGAEQALVAVVQEAYVNGVSTRKVDRLVEQMGLRGLSKDQVSHMCQGLDEQAETEAFWTEFLFSLKARGLSGVRLCVSDAHQGLINAIARVLDCRWQRCTVHFLRDMLGHCSRQLQPMIATAIRQTFNAETGELARSHLSEVAERLREPAPKVAGLLEGAEEELLAFYAVPNEHWPKLRSTNPLERVNKEIGRRSDVVGIYPNDRALIRLAGMLLIEQNDEWLVQRKYLSDQSIRLVLSDALRDENPRSNDKDKEVIELNAAGAANRPTDDHQLHHKTRLDCRPGGGAAAGSVAPPGRGAAAPLGSGPRPMDPGNGHPATLARRWRSQRRHEPKGEVTSLRKDGCCLQPQRPRRALASPATRPPRAASACADSRCARGAGAGAAVRAGRRRA